MEESNFFVDSQRLTLRTMLVSLGFHAGGVTEISRWCQAPDMDRKHDEPR
jgi:hypothetical protein